MTGPLDLAAVEAWIESVVGPVSDLELQKERPWATVLRATAGGEAVWFKACRPIQGFEPRLTAALAGRWPDRVARVLAHDEARAWLLTADAGTDVGSLGNLPEHWLRALPLYAELQRGEAAHAREHLASGVPDLRPAALPAWYERLVTAELPLEAGEVRRLRRFGRPFAVLCEELESASPVVSIQHDDLHLWSLFLRGDEVRILDWGDASVAHPFASLVVTFQFLEAHNRLARDDPWFARLRDAYLEPWGGAGLAEPFALAFRVGLLARAFAWLRQREAMPAADRVAFDPPFADLLRWVIERALGPTSGRG